MVLQGYVTTCKNAAREWAYGIACGDERAPPWIMNAVFLPLGHQNILSSQVQRRRWTNAMSSFFFFFFPRRCAALRPI